MSDEAAQEPVPPVGLSDIPTSGQPGYGDNDGDQNRELDASDARASAGSSRKIFSSLPRGKDTVSKTRVLLTCMAFRGRLIEHYQAQKQRSSADRERRGSDRMDVDEGEPAEGDSERPHSANKYAPVRHTSLSLN